MCYVMFGDPEQWDDTFGVPGQPRPTDPGLPCHAFRFRHLRRFWELLSRGRRSGASWDPFRERKADVLTTRMPGVAPAPEVCGITRGQPVPAERLAEALGYQIATLDFSWLTPDDLRDLVRVLPAGPCRKAWIVLGLLRPFWIRPLETWIPERGARNDVASLFGHLLVRYPLPEWLSTCTFNNVSSIGDVTAPLVWAVLLGQGARPREAGRVLGWNLPTEFWRQVDRYPAMNGSFTSQMLRCLAFMLGAYMYRDFDRLNRLLTAAEYPDLQDISPAMRSSLAGTLIRYSPDTGRWISYDRPRFCVGCPHRFSGCPSTDEHPGAVCNPRESYWQPITYVFWQETQAWLVQNRGSRELRDNWPNIWYWALHMQTEAHRERGVFSWKGRTVASVTRHAREYEHRRRTGILALTPPATSWAGHGLGWEHTQGNLRWRFTELTTQAALSQEGTDLQHCVGGYASSCLQQYSAIVSVRAWPMVPVAPEGPKPTPGPDAPAAAVPLAADPVETGAGASEGPARETGTEPADLPQHRCTIELRLADAVILQACGFQNRPPSKTVQQAIARWLAVVHSRG